MLFETLMCGDLLRRGKGRGGYKKEIPSNLKVSGGRKASAVPVYRRAGSS